MYFKFNKLMHFKLALAKRDQAAAIGISQSPVHRGRNALTDRFMARIE